VRPKKGGKFPLASAPANVKQTTIRVTAVYFFSQFPDASVAQAGFVSLRDHPPS
jgi:hypothetical protein